MFHVVLFICNPCERKQEESREIERLTARGDITSAQGKATLCTDEVEATEVVPFAERLLLAIWPIYGEELCCDDITTILRDGLTLRGYVKEGTCQTLETVEMEDGAKCTDERALHGKPTR